MWYYGWSYITISSFAALYVLPSLSDFHINSILGIGFFFFLFSCWLLPHSSRTHTRHIPWILQQSLSSDIVFCIISIIIIIITIVSSVDPAKRAKQSKSKYYIQQMQHAQTLAYVIVLMCAPFKHDKTGKHMKQNDVISLNMSKQFEIFDGKCIPYSLCFWMLFV